jgi:hypothetical protein
MRSLPYSSFLPMRQVLMIKVLTPTRHLTLNRLHGSCTPEPTDTPLALKSPSGRLALDRCTDQNKV